MTLITTITHDSTEFEIDLDDLDKYGSYYVDEEHGLIVNAKVYTQGTRDSRHLRDEPEIGTDYTFEEVNVDRESVTEHLKESLNVEPRPDEIDTAIKEYQRAGIEVVGEFAADLDGYGILRKASNDIISTDIAQPLLGWDQTLGNFIDRATKHSDTRTRREVTWELLTALRNASPGEYEYSARVKIIDQ